jgi:hypothetical protein
MNMLGAEIAKVLKAFYRDYVAITPHLNERPEVDLIIAARRGVTSEMWITKRNRLSKARSPVAVGSADAYARALLGRFDLPKQPETAMLLAAYVVFLVKERNLWVGGDTHVLCLDENTRLFPTKGLSGVVCRKLEEMFRLYNGVEARMLHRFLGSGYEFCEVERVQADLEIMRQRMDEYLHPKHASKSDSSQT